MHLESFTGDKYKSIENTGEIIVNPRITRFVGQNEAGKTALLELLYTLRPVPTVGKKKFALDDYPRKKFNAYKRIHAESPHSPVTATFLISDEEISEIEDNFGVGVLKSPKFNLIKYYDQDTARRTLSVNESVYIQKFLSKLSLEAETAERLKASSSIKALKSEVAKLPDEQKNLFKDMVDDLAAAVYSSLNVPHFFYFDDYSILPGEISLRKLQQFEADPKSVGEEADSLRTASALLKFAGAETKEFLEIGNYNRLKADLEAASNEITDKLRKYWTTNKNLEIEFDIEAVIGPNNQLQDTKLHIRVCNTKHRVTVPFQKRSKGFIWFFSFLVSFTEYREHDEEIILLLDEPGTNLGAVAQRDLMRYFDHELIPYHQVLYTTHSSHMIDMRQLETVRTVEDEEDGTKVSNDPYRHSTETLFPLQAALGFDLSQSLFVGPNNLLVEGPSDIIYIQLASQMLVTKGRQFLTPEWKVVPTGGIDRIATFVSLFGGHGLNLAVFMDVKNGDQQKIDQILKNKLLLRGNVITVGSILNAKEADIEDLFSAETYLKLVNYSYKKELNGHEIKMKELTDQSGRIVKRLETYFAEANVNGGKFSHYKPAFDLMMNPQFVAELFDEQSLKNFEAAFVVLNKAYERVISVAIQSLPVMNLKNSTPTRRIPEATI